MRVLGLNSFQLKIIAIILMVLDHLYKFIPQMPLIFTWLGRLVAPIFFFFVVEGFFYTSNKGRYLTRLLVWSGIMFIGTNIIVYVFPSDIQLGYNIFLSLSMAVILMMIFEWIKIQERLSTKSIGVLLALIIAIISLFTEASIIGVIMTTIFYYFRGRKFLISMSYIALSAALLIPVIFNPKGMDILSLDGFYSQWLMVFALPFLFLYNGQRGPNGPIAKYMFYFFYPFHLWIIYLVSNFYT